MVFGEGSKWQKSPKNKFNIYLLCFDFYLKNLFLIMNKYYGIILALFAELIANKMTNTLFQI